MKARLIPLAVSAAWISMTMPGAFGEGHVRGGCTIGESSIAHGRPDQDAVAEIRRNAQLYVTNFQKFRKSEFALREAINELLELEQWTQADIVVFTREQRELLYLSVGRQLATGRITTDELPEYVRTIRQRITDIEVELGCDVLPGE